MKGRYSGTFKDILFVEKGMSVLSFLLIMNASFSQKPPVNKNQDVKKLYMSPQIAHSFPWG